jgi:hypothetical protein
MKKLSIFTILLLLTTTLSAETITVTSGEDSGAGTLRQAIINANDGDEIVFDDNVTTVTLTNYGFTLNKSITISGHKENKVVITCNGRHFYMEENAGINVSLNYLTLRDGNASTCGGAIFNRKGNTLTLDNCIFINNHADTTGAVDNQGIITIDNCIFEDNSTPKNGVGAVCNTSGGDMSINSTTFINNKGTVGAIYNYPNSSISITNCIFKDNKGEVASAFWNRGIATLVNSLFVLNEHFSGTTRYERSGTISNYGLIESERVGIFLTVINSTIADNADEVGLYNDANATLYNNIIWNNGDGNNDVYTSGEGTTTVSNNLIGIDPLLNSDYSLQEGSPAIDAGDINLLALEDLTGLTDLAGNPRISNNKVDLGAYEFQKTNTGIVGAEDFPPTPLAYYNLLGVQLSAAPESGIYIVLYDNGKVEKKIFTFAGN